MSAKENDKKDNGKEKGRLTLSLSGSSGGEKAAGSAAPRPSGATGRRQAGKSVKVEVRRRRVDRPGQSQAPSSSQGGQSQETLSNEEREARLKALEQAKIDDERRKKEAEERARKAAEEVKEEEGKELSPEELRDREMEELRKIEEEEKKAAEDEHKRLAEENARRMEEQKERLAEEKKKKEASAPKTSGFTSSPKKEKDDDFENDRRSRIKGVDDGGRRQGKMTVYQALDSGNEEFERRRRRRPRKNKNKPEEAREKIMREVIIPDHITVQELSNRMTERGGDVIKKLMGMGMMVTITQSIDGDTAELVAEEFGHTVKRVSEADVEEGLRSPQDKPEDLKDRPPVVTVMGHVDHGKTSLLDALRHTDVVAGEAGGITQHIGAYQITTESKKKITFIDTPGHAAFTEMRARGANTTDIVILVVAADDGIKPQTIEAISHARAAEVPIVVAVNKIDLPAANPMQIKQDLLQHNVQIEEMGGDVQCVEVSAKQRMNLDKLEEAVLLQAEVLELKSNPDLPAEGAVVESKMEQGRGNVATVLVQRGTLRVGDVFVTGDEWGKVRALVNDKGKNVQEAGPAEPIEVLGLNGTPNAGDDFIVVPGEARAREVSEYRQRKRREAAAVVSGKGSIEQMFDRMKEAEVKELPVLIKGDVNGSVEALIGAFKKLTEENEEVEVKIVHSGVGGINESDITLANATKALVIGFNVRAGAQARDIARRDGIDIRYYSVIYNAIDDVKGMLGGLLSPEEREEITGYAEIRAIFNVPKMGKVGGCYVTEGKIGRGSRVRLLRDDVVVHDGVLGSLRRGKDDVKEVAQGLECGMGFEGYDDIKEGDMIEAYTIQEVAREL